MQFIERQDDPWHTSSDGATVSDLRGEANLLVTIEQWQTLRDRWPPDVPVGLVLANDADVSAVAAELPRFALVVLNFPKWVDGRAYSQAHLLRARHGYVGEVRATGDVVVDMLALLQRTGFDAVVLRAGQSVDAARRALGFFPAYYQGDVNEPRPLFERAAA